MNSFTDLEAWKIGLALVQEIYRLTKSFPKEEMFGLTSQMRRACTSILANLAEGFGRYTHADKAAKFTIARGECTETKAFLLLIAVSLNLLTEHETKKALEMSDHVGKLLSGLIAAAKKRQSF